MFVNQVIYLWIIAHTHSHHLLLYVGSSPLLVDPEENGMPLTIVVVDNSGRVAVTRGTIEIPTVPPPTTAPGSLIVAAWATYNSVVVDIVSWVDMWGGYCVTLQPLCPSAKTGIRNNLCLFRRSPSASMLFILAQCLGFLSDMTKVLSLQVRSWSLWAQIYPICLADYEFDSTHRGLMWSALA